MTNPIFSADEIAALESLDFTIVENTEESAILQLNIEAINIIPTVGGRYMMGGDMYPSKYELYESLYAEYLAQLTKA